jgi:hypothetical protein
MNAHHVLVRHLACEKQLLLESALERLRRLRVGPSFGADHLQRDHDPEHGIPGLVDGAHAAETEQPDDVIAIAEVLAERERAAGVVGGCVWHARHRRRQTRAGFEGGRQAFAANGGGV